MKNGNATLKIEKGVPVPPPKTGWGVLTEALTKMGKDESVEVDMTYNSAYQAAIRYLGMGKFIIRPTDGKNTSMSKRVRIWRTAD